MGKKHLSLIIVPHNKSEHRTISFSERFLKTAKWGGIILGVLLLGILIDYARIRINGIGYKNLTAENAKQKTQLDQYQSSIVELEKKINDFDSYRKKLNLMVGLKSDDVIKEAGVGGPSFAATGGQTIPALPDPGLGKIKGLQEKAGDLSKNFDALGKYFESMEARLSSTPSIFPTSGLMTSYFGWRADPFTGKQTFHSGLDIATAYGNPIMATANGVVTAINSDYMLGQSVQISHGLGYVTIYGHMSRIIVKFVGQKVKRGETIGEVGSTGKAIGPHVHYEVRVNGVAVDPRKYILEE